MDYKKMMMETPEETMKRFERKRKLKEVLCKFGLIAHKVPLGSTTHFAFALATPSGTPIARPCSSEDLAECSQWLASKYPAHFFFQGAERPSSYESQGGARGSDARYGATPPSDSKPLQCDVSDQLASTKKIVDLYTTTEIRSHDRVHGSIRDEYPYLPVEKRLHELHPSELRRVDDQQDDARHCERTSPLDIFVSPWDSPPGTNSPNIAPGRNLKELEKARDGSDRKSERPSGGHGHEQLKRSKEEGCHRELEIGHAEHKKRGNGHDGQRGHGEHRHRTKRKDRSVANHHHSSRDGSRARGRTRKDGTGTTRKLTSKSDEGSGICGQVMFYPCRVRLDPTSRLAARLMNVEKWDCLQETGPPGVGPGLIAEKNMLESNAESRPHGLSTPSHTVSGRLKRTNSSDISLSQEPFGLQTNERTRHSDSRYCHPKVHRSELGTAPSSANQFQQHMSEGVDTRSGENQGGHPECDIIVADENLIHRGVKGEKSLAWKPSPLYQPSATPAPEKSESSFDSVCTSANDQDYDDEACEREERALIRYLRLYADDKSWKEGFESADGLTCDVCNLGGKIKRVPDVKALVSHAKTMKRIKMAEHRGYARAICELMNFDTVALDTVNKAKDLSSKRPPDDTIVWPPVLVLENTRTEKGPDGQWKGVDETELTEILQVALAHKGRSHTFRPICGKNGHKGRVLVEFPPSRQAWVDATTLHKQFKINARGYTEWLAVKPRWRHLGPDRIIDGSDFVRLDDTGNPKRVLYGYLAEPRHMEVFDPSRKYVQNWKIVSKDVIL